MKVKLNDFKLIFLILITIAIIKLVIVFELKFIDVSFFVQKQYINVIIINFKDLP